MIGELDGIGHSAMRLGVRDRGIRYVELPEAVRKALWHYHRSGGTDPRNVRWLWKSVKLGRIARELWKHTPDMRADFRDFDAYHRWYVREHGIPGWAGREPDSIFAVMLSGPPGGPYEGAVIEDGWHRFHYYLDRYGPGFGVPVVWWVSG